MADAVIYEPIQTQEFRQGEILSGVIESALSEDGLKSYLAKRPDNQPEVNVSLHDFAVILSQDCEERWKDLSAELPGLLLKAEGEDHAY